MDITKTREEYIEAIWRLTKERGYARVTDIAQQLGVKSTTVSKMIKKLAEDGFLIYEKYRVVSLTSKGNRLGSRLFEHHQILREFLQRMGLDDHEEIDQIVEGCEHYFSPNALNRIETLNTYIQLNPDWWSVFAKWSTLQE